MKLHVSAAGTMWETQNSPHAVLDLSFRGRNSQESGTHMTNERALPQCSLLSQRPVQQLPTRSTCASRDLFRPAWSSQRSGRKPWRLDSPREHPSTNDRWTVSGQSQQVPHLSGGIPLKQTFLHCHSDSPWP